MLKVMLFPPYFEYVTGLVKGEVRKEAASKVKFLIPNIFDHIFWGAKLLFLQHLSRKSGPHAESASTRNRSFGRETNPSKL